MEGVRWRGWGGWISAPGACFFNVPGTVNSRAKSLVFLAITDEDHGHFFSVLLDFDEFDSDFHGNLITFHQNRTFFE